MSTASSSWRRICQGICHEERFRPPWRRRRASNGGHTQRWSIRGLSDGWPIWRSARCRLSNNPRSQILTHSRLQSTFSLLSPPVLCPKRPLSSTLHRPRMNVDERGCVPISARFTGGERATDGRSWQWTPSTHSSIAQLARGSRDRNEWKTISGPSGTQSDDLSPAPELSHPRAGTHRGRRA